jgi:predicted Zn-dependent protease
MNAYARHDCSAAVKALADVKAPDQYRPMARLYSGVCLMHDGEMASATRSLKAAALVSGSPEQETAWYYLAQIALTEDDAIKARHYLDLTISSHGDLEQRARGELKRIPAD